MTLHDTNRNNQSTGKSVIKTFLKCQWLNLWWHAALVILAATVLVGLSGYKIVGLPLLFIYGIGDGHPSLMDKTIGVLLLVLFAAIALYIAYLTIVLFVRLSLDKTRSKVFRAVFIVNLLLVVAANILAMWTSNAESRVHNAIYIGDIAAYENALKWCKAGNIDDDLWCAARDGQLQMVQYLISKGANPNAKLGGNGDSVLAGADPNVMNRPDGNKPVIEYLKSHGATNESSR